MKLIKKFISYYKPHKKLFFIDMICALLVAICNLIYPLIAKNIINDYVPNQKLSPLIICAAILLLIYVIKAFLNYFIQYWGHVVGVRIQGDMRVDMFKKLQKLPFSFYDENKTGAIMSRIINDLFEISELAHHGPEDLFLSVIMLLGSFIILSSINIYLTLIIFAFIPFIVFFAIRMRKSMNEAFSLGRKEIAKVNANVENSISGMRISRAYTAEAHETKKFEKANNRFKKVRGMEYRSMGLFFSGMGLFTDLLYLVVLVAGGLFFFNGTINVGEFATYILYISTFLNPINRLVSLFEQFQQGITGFVRFNEIIEQNEEPELPDAIDVPKLKGDISFNDVSFKYQNSDAKDKSLVINHLNLKIDKGKTVALVGPSGTGKTTLCHLIPRFYELDCGNIEIDGIDITKLTRQSLRKNVGIVAQDVFLFDGTIRENIAYGNLDATDQQIIEAAKLANIHDFIQTLENGYDTGVGERGVKLSGGQKQRISIARVFLKNPPILILDEATSALDNATEMQIQSSLEKLSKGRTTLIVAHRLSTIKNADEIVVLTKDGIVEQGTHDQLIANNGLYKSLYQYQFNY
jgi:ABC transporter